VAQKFGALCLIMKRFTHFILSYEIVTLEQDYKKVALLACSFYKTNVTNMENIEATAYRNGLTWQSLI
jgi:hypothetical protein